MKGFTLLEMILATALLAILMIGVLAVIATLGPAAAASAPVDPPGFPTPQVVDALVQTLSNDLSQSASARSSDDLAELSGSIGLDEFMNPLHRPAIVQYSLQDIDSSRWLVRKQTLLDGQTPQPKQIDLVCRGISRFQLLRVPSQNSSGAVLWRLRLWSSEPDAPAFDRLIIGSPKVLHEPIPK